jgi:hypothetical protein
MADNIAATLDPGGLGLEPMPSISGRGRHAVGSWEF